MPVSYPYAAFAALADRDPAALRHESRLVEASAPGRVELAGNHVDHQGGCTISAAVGQRCRCLAARRDDGSREARLVMEGFGEATLRVDDLDPRPEERGTSTALVRGMLAGYARSGAGRLAGFDLAVCSDVPAGCGLSSSAAFEMMLATTLHRLFDEPGAPDPDPVGLALWGSHVEQAYFGKLAGAQDQLASLYGGVSLLDFSAPRPVRTALDFDPHLLGCTPMLVDSRCEHAQHTDEFSSITSEMSSVAALLGAARLIDVPFAAFLAALPEVRAQLGDRPALRALHFYEETRRVKQQARALRAGDRDGLQELLADGDRIKRALDDGEQASDRKG